MSDVKIHELGAGYAAPPANGLMHPPRCPKLKPITRAIKPGHFTFQLPEATHGSQNRDLAVLVARTNINRHDSALLRHPYG